MHQSRTIINPKYTFIMLINQGMDLLKKKKNYKIGRFLERKPVYRDPEQQ